MRNEVLLSVELKKADVHVYTNRIELAHKGVSSMFT